MKDEEEQKERKKGQEDWKKEDRNMQTKEGKLLCARGWCYIKSFYLYIVSLSFFFLFMLLLCVS